MKRTLAFWLYFLLLAPLTRFLLHLLASFLNAKMQAFVRGKDLRKFRFSIPETELRGLRPVWIHAASGEIEYARPVIRALQEKHPELPILVTYSSPSAIRMLENIPGLAAWGPAPWEAAQDMRDFLNRFRPRALLVARTDLWPIMARQTKKAGLPMMMFAATFARNSSRLKGLSRALNLYSLSMLDSLQVVSTEDVQVWGEDAKLLATEIAGDTRFDQVFHRLENPKPLPESLRPQQGPVLIAGSTWPEDEAPLLEAFSKSPSWRMILAPHETTADHLLQLEGKLSKLQIPFRKFSDGGEWNERVLLVDQVGILAELYTWGDLAFVGGSFKKQIHSVMEPLAAGLRVLVGPFHENNREALHFQKVTAGGYALVQPVHNSGEIQKQLEDLSAGNSKEDVKALIREKRGATEKVLRWLEKNQRVSETTDLH